VAGVAGQPAGDSDQPPAQGGNHGLAAAHAVPVQDVLAGGDGGELVVTSQTIQSSSSARSG
jgi:hypothetical protein